MPGFGSNPGFYRKQLFTTLEVPPENIDLSDKTILLTGATSGVGFECARHLVQRGVGRLILPVRSLQRGQDAQQRLLKETTSDRRESVELYEMDMESFDSVIDFVTKLKSDLSKPLDIVILNAGLQPFYKDVSKSTGIEVALQVNHLSTALLAIVLLPLMKSPDRRGPGKMTIVSSSSHFWTDFNERKAPHILTCLNEIPPKDYSAMQYHATKLLNVFFTRSLSERISKDSIVINTVNPGAARTRAARFLPFGVKIAYTVIAAIVMRSAEVASRTLTHAAIIAGPESHGQFLSECNIDQVSTLVTSEEGHVLEERLWDETYEWLVKVAPSIEEILPRQLERH